MQLKMLQKRFPGADSVAGRVVAFHQGKHYILGTYVGDGVVVLSKDGERLLADAPKSAPKKPASVFEEVQGLNLDDVKI